MVPDVSLSQLSEPTKEQQISALQEMGEERFLPGAKRTKVKNGDGMCNEAKGTKDKKRNYRFVASQITALKASGAKRCTW
ncbi:MAG: hypothetical protein HC767_07295 [Akkermansiaceae bacterium]|nr:hypothetical protein [Akkermansiaceae bacterium]